MSGNIFSRYVIDLLRSLGQGNVHRERAAFRRGSASGRTQGESASRWSASKGVGQILWGTVNEANVIIRFPIHMDLAKKRGCGCWP